MIHMNFLVSKAYKNYAFAILQSMGCVMGIMFKKVYVPQLKKYFVAKKITNHHPATQGCHKSNL